MDSEPKLSLDVSSMTFDWALGDSPMIQTVNIFNNSGGTLTWNKEYSGEIAISSNGGSEEIQVRLNKKFIIG